MTKRNETSTKISLCLITLLTLLLVACAIVGFGGTSSKVYAAAVTIDQTEEVGSGTTKNIASEFMRAPNFQGDMYVVKSGGTLTLKSGAILDGNRDNIVFGKQNANKFVDGALVKVESGGTLIIEDGAILKNNADTAIKTYGNVQVKGGTISNCGSLWGYDVNVIPSKYTYSFVDSGHGEWDIDTYSEFYKNEDDMWNNENSLLDYLNANLSDWSNALIKAQDGSMSAADAKTLIDTARTNILDTVISQTSIADENSWYWTPFGNWSGSTQDMFTGCTSSGSSNHCYQAFNNHSGTIIVDGVALPTIPENSTHIQKEEIVGGEVYEYGEDSYTQKGGAIYGGEGSTITIDGGFIGGDGESGEEVFYAIPVVQTGQKTYINANLATDGGAVYIEGNASLTINGGKMAFNDVANRFTHIPEYAPTANDQYKYTPVVTEEHGLGGAVYVGRGSVVNLHGGDIGDFDTVTDSLISNRANGGAGINVASGATLNITGGNIRGNKTMFGLGGAIRVDGGVLNMDGGVISNNTTFWGVIGGKDNQNSGAGVAVVSQNSLFNMSDGEITGNISVHNGAGVFLGETASGSMTFNMTGGLIQNNKAVGEAGCEVYIESGNKKIDFSGGAVVHTITSPHLDESALYVVNNSAYAANSDNYIKLDGTIFTGVFYLTKNTQYFTATANGAASVYKLAVSDDFVSSPYKKVIEIEGNDATLRDTIMQSSSVVTPSKRLTTDSADNHIYILGYNNGNSTHYIDGYTTPQVTYGTELPLPEVKVTASNIAPVGDIEYTYYKLDEVTGVYIKTNFTTSNRPKNVGKYKIEAVITNQAQQTAVNFEFEVVKRDITITVDSYDVMLGYEFTPPSDKVTVPTLSYDDKILITYSAAATGKPETTTATKYFTVGAVYDLVITASHSNYNITFGGTRKVTITDNAVYTKFVADYADIINKLPDSLTYADATTIRDALGEIYDMDAPTGNLLEDETTILEKVLDEMAKYLEAFDALAALEPFIPDSVIEANSSIAKAMLEVASKVVDAFVADGGKPSDLPNYDNFAKAQAAINANDFRVKHKEILATDIADITKEHLSDIKSALTDYGKLKDDTKALLVAQKQDLDIKYNKAFLDKTYSEAIEAIDQKVDSMKNSGKYDAAGKAQIESLKTEGKAALGTQTTASGVNTKLQEYIDKLNDVKIASTGPIAPPDDNGNIIPDDEVDYDANHDFKADGYYGSVNNQEGMDSDVELVIKDKDKTDSIAKAINANKDIKNTSLRGVIDVNLMKDGAVYIGSGVYNVKVLLPEQMRGDDTVRLAKVNADGSVSVIESRVDGNYLYFATGDFGNFVIVAKDDVNLWWLIIILFIIILAQIAVVVMLILKRKSDESDTTEGGSNTSNKDNNGKKDGQGKNKANGQAKAMSLSPALLILAAFIPSPAITIIVIEIVAIVGLAAYIAYLLLRRNNKQEILETAIVEGEQEPIILQPINVVDDTIVEEIAKEVAPKPKTTATKPKTTKPKTDETKPKSPKPKTDETTRPKTTRPKPTQPKLDKVAHADVHKLMTDTVAKSHMVERGIKVDKSHKDIVNLDVLSLNFNDGDIVTLDNIKAKGLIGKKTTYYKVLARGIINKAITVEANEFSIDAVKMLVLTGGKVTKLTEK